MCRSSPLFALVLTLFAAKTAADIFAKTVCYDEYGCFTTGPPFGLTLHRPIALLPDAPNVIDTRFLLYTRQSLNDGQLISRHATFGRWDRTKPTRILVHGFLDTINSAWWTEMKNAFLQAEDCNVILTDWSRANYFPYTKASANAQVVGIDIALLVNQMINSYGANPADFHIIAHSLGAAVAGYAGQRITRLGRITGLDPASPLFEDTDPIVHLDSSDAQFVDIIHTDGTPNIQLGFGTLTQLGHVDFYPNGGANQPACPETTAKLLDAIITMGPMDIIGPMDIQGFFNTTMCSHFAAVHLFTNTILNRCVYRGFSCENYEDFQQGRCLLNRNEGNFMGYRASPQKALGRLYLNTQTVNTAPFCTHHYQVSLISGSHDGKTKGQIDLTLIGNQAIERVPFDSDEMVLKEDSVETRYIPLKSDLGTIQRIDIAFKRTDQWFSSVLYSDEWMFEHVTATDGDRQISMTFCPQNGNVPLRSGSTASFFPC